MRINQKHFAILTALFFVFAIFKPTVGAAMQQQKPAYEVYAISYGVIPDFPVSGLIAGADKSRKLDIQTMVWLLKGSDGRNILVDAGFYRDKFFKQWKVRDFIKPSEAIAKLGLKPEDITDLIITHMHWDHADGMDLFPRANICNSLAQPRRKVTPVHLLNDSDAMATGIAAMPGHLYRLVRVWFWELESVKGVATKGSRTSLSWGRCFNAGASHACR